MVMMSDVYSHETRDSLLEIRMVTRDLKLDTTRCLVWLLVIRPHKMDLNTRCKSVLHIANSTHRNFVGNAKPDVHPPGKLFPPQKGQFIKLLIWSS